jgi:hypothetical protein
MRKPDEEDGCRQCGDARRAQTLVAAVTGSRPSPPWPGQAAVRRGLRCGGRPLLKSAARPRGACQRGSCRPGRASPIGQAGASTIRCEARSCSPAVPSPCHSQHDAFGLPRSATDTHGPLTCGGLTRGVRQHEW